MLQPNCCAAGESTGVCDPAMSFLTPAGVHYICGFGRAQKGRAGFWYLNQRALVCAGERAKAQQGNPGGPGRGATAAAAKSSSGAAPGGVAASGPAVAAGAPGRRRPRSTAAAQGHAAVASPAPDQENVPPLFKKAAGRPMRACVDRTPLGRLPRAFACAIALRFPSCYTGQPSPFKFCHYCSP